ncbi:MAG TPA: sulfatase, partial [Acidobacteriota bacterium]|nr:sulfatase [Acidobacteriota bacterium]
SRIGYRDGSVYVDLPDWAKDDWRLVVIRARTKDRIGWIGLSYNLRQKAGTKPNEQGTFMFSGQWVNLIRDGEVHTYVLQTDTDVWPQNWKDPWTQLGIAFGANEREKDTSDPGPQSLDILSVSVVPRDLLYAKTGVGSGRDVWGLTTRSLLYAHAPGTVAYDVRVPDKGRLDFGFGLLKKTDAVRFRVSAREPGAEAASKVLLEEDYSGDRPRLQRSVDLSAFAGKTISLVLETSAERPGCVAFWGSPTLSGARASTKPNIVFYVIDGASSEFMSVYGYNRRTTPFLERLAAEGAVFENAYSNSSWTKISVPSFMTSLHNSVFGGNETESDALPDQAVPMSERLHKAGYLTEVLTSNPYCGRLSSLDRGVDRMVDTNPNASAEEVVRSEDLHRDFWNAREAYPAEPYWVHFQPTDVHMPWKPIAPFAGLFATPEERREFDEMLKKIQTQTGESMEEIIKKSVVDVDRYFYLSRKLYDESMAHQDYTIGKLVERIKDRGEWGNTLFIVAADHGHEAAGLTLFDPRRPNYPAPFLASQCSKIPMIFVWAGKIAPGRRITQPVSMIDMLPTILDLAGLPAPETAQGQSLAPLLLGRPGGKARPVVFDEFTHDNEYFYGSIEVVDGQWGASLRIDNRPDEKKTAKERLRPAPLLIFDVWEDPHAFKSLHAERPDLVAKYSKMLDAIWKEHQALAKKFSRAASVSLTPQQVETLRSLGYLR